MNRAALLAACLLLAGPAAAQVISPLTGTTTAPAATAMPRLRHRPTLAERFDAANTTHDGRLTRRQAWSGHMNEVARNFKAIDTQARGYVTMDDIRAHSKPRRPAPE